MKASSLLFVVAFLTLGCSEVLVEPQGTGGRGGFDDDGGSGAGKPGPSTSSTMKAGSSSTGFDPTLNEAFCNAAGQCFASCVGASQSFQYAPCEDAGAALVLCLADNYDSSTCSVSGCESQVEALLACRAASPVTCGIGGCGASDTDCTCSGVCPSGDQIAICENVNGQATCGCYLNTLHVGSCTAPWDFSDTFASCGYGCCADVFGSIP